MQRFSKSKDQKSTPASTFVQFLEDPPIAASLLVIGLIALAMSILEFSAALRYY